MRYGKLILFVLLSALLSPSALARDPAVDNIGARALGRGSVGIADPGDAGGAQLSLASASLQERYEVVAGVGIGTDDYLMQRGLAIDSRTTVVTLALGYTRWTDSVDPPTEWLPGWYPEGEEITDATTHQGLWGGIAYPMLGRRMSLGVDARWDWRDSDLNGQTQNFNFGASFSAKPHEMLTIAVAGRELLDLGYRDTERSLDAGIRFDPGVAFGIEADVRTELMGDPVLENLDYSAGIDVSVVRWLSLRGGWTLLEGHHNATAGLALTSDKADLDYGVRWELDDVEALRTWHGLDVRFKF